MREHNYFVRDPWMLATHAILSPTTDDLKISYMLSARECRCLVAETTTQYRLSFLSG
jgi:hypothetical protein